MVFSSILFLYFFLPIVLVGYYVLTSNRARNLWLLSASLLFYAWSEKQLTLWMLTSIGVNFILGQLLVAYPTKRWRETVLTLGLLFNLTLLFSFKYLVFFLRELNNAPFLHRLHTIYTFPTPGITLPLGISFYTFHNISYLMDIFREKSKPQKSIVNFSHYICLFPQLIAGPIIRYHDIAHELNIRKINNQEFSYGVKRFVVGLAKKVLIANYVAHVVDKIYAIQPELLSTPLAWIASVGYMLQIYFDFSGYSDMAIGLAVIFGFHFKENFNEPYKAKSITEFWQRWHISLSTWFRDYLYIPMGGNRGSPAQTYRNLVIVFLLCGFWHGASWNFIAWGAFYGAFLVIERSFRNLKWARPPATAYLYVWLVTISGWVIFRSRSLGHANVIFKAMLGFNHIQGNLASVNFFLGHGGFTAYLVGLFFTLPLFDRAHRWLQAKFQKIYIGEIISIFLFFVCTIELIANTYNPFIYFRF